MTTPHVDAAPPPDATGGDPPINPLNAELEQEKQLRQSLEAQVATLTAQHTETEGVQARLAEAEAEVARLQAQALTTLRQSLITDKGADPEKVKDLTVEQLELLRTHLPDKATLPTPKGLDLAGNGGADLSSLTAREKIMRGLG